VLRIKSRIATYWKAQNLDGFDGIRWTRTAPLRPVPPEAEVPAAARRNRAWRMDMRVTLRDFSTSDVLGAGTTISFDRTPTSFSPGSSPGTWVSDEPLEPGDGYVAKTIVPRPRQAALRAAHANYPTALLRYLLVGLPMRGDAATAPRFRPGAGVAFVPPFGTAPTEATPQARIAERLLAASPYARSYALAQQLASGSGSPYAFVQRVLDYLRTGFEYSETPPRRQLPLEAFLFRDRAGYCQQFAGAAALLLRMGGVPTRIAAGFTSGSRDGARGEYVVRDYDAHAWIEVWFPRIGWVRFDPTPSTAPARSGRAPQAAPTRTATTPAPLPRAPDVAADASPDVPSQGSSDGGSGVSPLAFVGLGLALAALGTGLVVRRSLLRPRDADALLAELERALRRTGRPPEPQLTLLALERRLHDAPDAAGYVRAVRLARFGDGPAEVSPRQRRALRAELARGLGLGGRVRALFALPPRFGR
jgi:transglutaminase-like putative cysteine protease